MVNCAQCKYVRTNYENGTNECTLLNCGCHRTEFNKDGYLNPALEPDGGADRCPGMVNEIFGEQ